MRTTLCSARCRMVAPWPPEEGTSPATGYSLPFMGRGAPSPLQGYYDPRGSDQRETHIPLQSSPSRVGSQLSEGSSMHTMPPWHWILEGPPQGCLTFCSPPPPATHMPGQLRPSLVGSHLSWGSSTHDMPTGHLMTLGPPQGSCFFPPPVDCACVADLP